MSTRNINLFPQLQLFRECEFHIIVNPLDSKGNYSATSNNTKLVGCYIWYREEEPGRHGAPPSPLLAVPNVIAHPSTASVPITVLLYDGRCSAVLM